MKLSTSRIAAALMFAISASALLVDVEFIDTSDHPPVDHDTSSSTGSQKPMDVSATADRQLRRIFGGHGYVGQLLDEGDRCYQNWMCGAQTCCCWNEPGGARCRLSKDCNHDPQDPWCHA